MKVVKLFEEQTYMVTERRVHEERESAGEQSLNEIITANMNASSTGVTSLRNIKCGLWCRKEMCMWKLGGQ